MALVCDLKSAEAEKAEMAENPDLEDGEIEDDDDDDEIQEQPPQNDTTTQQQQQQQQIKDTNQSQILPAPIPTDTNIFTQQNDAAHPPKEKRRRSTDRKSEKHLTEAEKCVRMLHRMERAERERRDRMRREQVADDWAGNVEKAIASVLKKDKSDRHSVSGGEDDEDDEKARGRKRKKRDRRAKKKRRRGGDESPAVKNEEIDDDELLNIRGGSPENKTTHKENSPAQEGEDYESYDSEYDSESYHNNRQNKRNYERDQRKNRNRNRESRRERRKFNEKNRKKESEQNNRQQLQDAHSICMFYMQGKCQKGDECPFSHDALPPMKLELCKFYLMDCCAKRDKCLYMHSEFPCKYYHTGLKCFAKDNCKFAHGKPLSDSLKQVLLKHLETAPKEILGDFPRLSREGAQHMVNQTQKNLENQYGIKNPSPSGPPNEKTNIPSLFDITIPVPPELIMQQQPATNENEAAAGNKTETKPTAAAAAAAAAENKSLEKPTKVRHTRWNDEPPIAVMPLLNQAFVGAMGGIFSSLTPQDQQKIQEYQLSYQMKGFYSEQDQDMRINSNGDVDMRALPQMMPKIEPSVVAFEQYKQDAAFTQNMSAVVSNDIKMDIDSRHMGSDSKLMIAEDHKTDNSSISVKKEQEQSDSSANTESRLTIDEKIDSSLELPSNLPKKQRELFLRIQAQQKENIPENQHSNADAAMMKDDDWYSSDDENDPLSKMVIHLEDEEKDDDNGDEVDVKKEKDQQLTPAPILSPPTIKPVEVIDKLGDLSKIDISAEVTKLLTSIKSGQTNTSSSAPSAEVKKSRDPRQAKNIDMEIKSPVINTDPRTTKPPSSSSTTERKEHSRPSIYEQGIINPEEKLSIYEQGTAFNSDSAAAAAAKGDVDLRSLNKDLDMRPSFGDTDLRQSGRQDVDLRQLGLPFKAIQNYTPATEIDASIGSHSPITYKVHVVDIPRPDYTGLKLNAQDSQVTVDPRLRKIFRVPSTDEKDSPASPKQQSSPPKPARQDPRRRAQQHEETTQQKTDNLSYTQQLQLLQNSAFYQSLTSSQKLMLNQEISSKGDQTTSNDPILSGILSSLGLIPSLSTANGCAMNILANVNNLVPNINPMMQQNMPGNMGQNMNPNMGPNMNNMSGGPMGPPMGQGMLPMAANNPGITPNLGPGLLGPAPVIPIGPNMGGNQNEFQINFDPRNGGLLGQAPFQNYQNDNQQNFQYNDEFYPNNDEGGNFGGGGGVGGGGGGNNNYNNPPRNERNFRGERNSQNNNRRGRSWNNRHNNSRNYNRNNRNRSNRSFTPP